jgi:glycerophosphoryl diester phosphodiesterase
VIRIVAHRGLRPAPDNSLAAVAAAVEAGLDVEVDVRRGAGGEPVLSHDPPLPGAAPDSLAAALQIVAAGGVRITADIKEPGIAADVVAAMDAARLHPGRRFVIAGRRSFVREIAAAAGRDCTGYIAGRYPWRLWGLRRLPISGVILDPPLSRRQWAWRIARRHGLAVEAGFINDRAAAEDALVRGARALVSDTPLLLRP